jgi:hypothetical protein
MAHAQKKMDVIPTEMIVQIYTWEGLLHDASTKLAYHLKMILDGKEEHWGLLDENRKRVVFYNQEYTKAILRLQRSQNKG